MLVDVFLGRLSDELVSYYAIVRYQLARRTAHFQRAQWLNWRYRFRAPTPNLERRTN
jgi:hypothetical protein